MKIKLLLPALLFLLIIPANAQIKGSVEHDQAKVQEILNKFLVNLGKDTKKYSITVEKSDELNAYATLGRKIVVYTGLIDSLKSESALAFVIAHELGHIEENHVFRTLLRENFFVAIKYFFFRESAIYDGVNLFRSLHHSRGSEKEADIFASKLIAQEYCNVPGKFEFFENSLKTNNPLKISEYISSHPLPVSRLEYLKSEIEKSGCAL